MEERSFGKISIRPAPPPIAQHLSYRWIVPQDLPVLFAWNNTEEVVRYLPSMPRPLSWEQHVAWAKKAMASNNRQDFMIDYLEERWTDLSLSLSIRPVGRIHASDLRDPSPEVGVLIGDRSVWGRGIATEAIGHILGWLWERGPWERCHALIHPENMASQRAFEKNGFLLRGETGRGGQWKYERVIER